MGVNLIEKHLHVGKTDSYSLTVSSLWLNGDGILTASVSSNAAKILVGDISIVENVIFVYLTGVEATPYSDVHFEYTTSTRSDCEKVRIIVDDC